MENTPDLETLVGSANFFWCDGECVDDPKDYHSFINNAFIGIAEGTLTLDHFDAGFTEDYANWLKIGINGQDFEVVLEDYRGWVNPSLIKHFNIILEALNLGGKRFFEVRDESWGQEIGVAFVSEQCAEKLAEFNYLTD